MEVTPRWLSVEGAKAYASLSREVIVAAVRSGDLRAYMKPSYGRRTERYRQYRISTEDIDEWLRSQPSAKEGTCWSS